MQIAPYNPAMPDNVKKAADDVKSAIIAGTLHPVTGPITDNKGTPRLKDGEKATDEMLEKMDWYVEGVQS
ncbi:MAG: hypothetical protein JO124_12900 [Hyphomicrobiales bacterium]|nr:hypothetical protein [Hyphomicrobiales bacterium]